MLLSWHPQVAHIVKCDINPHLLGGTNIAECVKLLLSIHKRFEYCIVEQIEENVIVRLESLYSLIFCHWLANIFCCILCCACVNVYHTFVVITKYIRGSSSDLCCSWPKLRFNKTPFIMFIHDWKNGICCYKFYTVKNSLTLWLAKDFLFVRS